MRKSLPTFNLFYIYFLVSILISPYLYGQINLLKDINPNGSGVVGNQMTVFKNHLYFVANDGNTGSELWRSDGTETGTVLFSNLTGDGSGSGPDAFTITDSHLYFTANTSSNGKELYRTDGISQPTLVNETFVGNGSSAPQHLVGVGDQLYYVATDSDFNKNLYLIDASGSSTKLTENLVSFREAIAFNNTLIFSAEISNVSAGRELFITDGSVEGTELLKDVWSGTTVDSSPELFTVVGNHFFFRAETAFGMEPWVSDGTTAGTKLLKDIITGSDDSNPVNFTNFDSLAYFSVTDSNGDQQIWKSDGTTENTIPVKSLSTRFGDELTNFTATENYLYFMLNSNDFGRELWKTDGSDAATQLVKDINSGSSNGVKENDDWFAIGEKLYFPANDGATGFELWSTNGLEDSTLIVQDLYTVANANSSPKNFTLFNELLFFAAFDGTNLTELRYYKPQNTGGGGGDPSPTLINGFVYQFNSMNPDNSNRLNDVTVENQFTGETVYTDANGNFEIEAEDGHNISFTKEGYTSFNLFLDLTNGTTYEIPLSLLNPCENVSCELGDQCYAGECYKVISGQIKDKFTSEFLANVQIDNLSYVSFNSISDQNGNYSILALEGDTITFSLAGYNNYSIIVTSNTTKYNIELISNDPCAGVSCPLGDVCIEGSCFSIVLSALAKDQFSNPLANVLIYNYDSKDSLYSQEDGSFLIFEKGQYRFSKAGYNPVSLNIYGISFQTIILEEQNCENTYCPLGDICFLDQCQSPDDLYTYTLAIKEEGSELPLANINVHPIAYPDDYSIITSENGIASFTLENSSKFSISDPSGNFQDLVINVTEDAQTIYLKKSNCLGVNCLLGEVCYDGLCQFEGTGTFSGYAFDKDSLPFSNVTIVANNQQVETDSYGFFSFNVQAQIDSTLVSIHKNGYISFDKTLVSNSINELYLNQEDLCYNISCPLGYVCYEGSCYNPIDEPNNDLCSGVYCPLGMVCVDGTCIEPCQDERNSSLCPDQLTNACDNVYCQLGQICYEGSCYDYCPSNEDPEINCSQDIIDPCEYTYPPPGYYCQNGIILPNCTDNGAACLTDDLCSVISCAPNEICFSCFDSLNVNSSGSALIEGVFNFSNPGARSNINKNLFIYLIEINSGRKTSIAKSNTEGTFKMQNIPSGQYKIFTSSRNYYASEYIVEINDYDKINLSISSNNKEIIISETRITSINEYMENKTPLWYPVPNETQKFYLNTEDEIKTFILFDIQGREKNISYTHTYDNYCSEVIINTEINPGIYILKWSTESSENTHFQRIILR